MTEQYILSDGGMVRNIPVDVARNLCADVVIVVNLVEQELKREKLQTATQLILRSSDVGIMANENLQLESLTDRDIRIDVIMGDITTADFERVPDTIPLGRKGGPRNGRASWLPLAVPPAEYARMARRRDRRPEHRDAAGRRAVRGHAAGQSRIPGRACAGESRRYGRHGHDQRRSATHVRPAGIRVGRVPADGRPGEPDAGVVAAGEGSWTELPQVRPGPVRLRRRRPGLRRLCQAHADLAQLAGR